MSVFLRHLFKEDQRWRMVIEDYENNPAQRIRAGLNHRRKWLKIKIWFWETLWLAPPNSRPKNFFNSDKCFVQVPNRFFLVTHQFISHLIIGQSTINILQGDFASGFARQSLPLTWGTGPRWLRHLLLIFNLRFARVKNKPKVPHLFA